MKVLKMMAFVALSGCGAAIAAPSVVAEHQANGRVSFEFIADSSAPVAAFSFSVPLRNPEQAKVAEECLTAPPRFALLCNVHEGQLKVIVFSTNPDAAVPSANLGSVLLPSGSLSLAKSGEIEGFSVDAYDALANKVASEVLSVARGGESGGRATTQER